MEKHVYGNNTKQLQLSLLIIYPVNDVVDVIIHVRFSVKSIVSLPVVLEIFQEQMFERHQIVFFERSHHFIAQAERDQLWKWDSE